MTRSILWFTLLAGSTALHAAPSAPRVQVAPAAAGLVKTREFPPVALRGYGTLSGTLWARTSGKPASLLQVRCESAAKAKLTHAKFLSDLGVLPGVAANSLATEKGALPVREVAGQGWLAAVRGGREVFVLAAQTPDDLAMLFTRALQPGALKLSLAPEVPVPMYLDRWDRFGFRFYYREWETPPGQKEPPYDPAGEFDFARKNERAGLVFWDAPMATDTAEGLMNEGWWRWAEQAASARRLPVGINLSIGPQLWLANRYREETAQKMPGYCGSFYTVADSHHGGEGLVSWNAGHAKDVQLGEIQQSVRRLAADPSVVNWLEPHGELHHGAHDIFMEYGPVADGTFRRYLRERYGSLAAVSRRWTGRPNAFSRWEDVRVPEVASFLGWGAQAIDLAGEWRVGYPEAPAAGTPANAPIAWPEEWLQPGFADTGWPTVTAPGHDRTMFLPKKPAVYRCAFEVPPVWKTAHPRAWLYIWDLNLAWNQKVVAVLNGRRVGESTIRHPVPHWDAFEVSAALQPGRNVLGLALPQGYLAYRVYLSPEPPLQYPNLGEQKNALWVDFARWIAWSRVSTARRGLEMIRQVDPNRQITMMAPDHYADGIKELCEAYGAAFHNTGYMAAFWADYLPLLMAGADLPFSLEPGGPAANLREFRKFIGLWATEGVQGIDYFIHIGNVFWNEEIRREFEEKQRVIRLVGKYHVPAAEVAVLFSPECETLTGYPWGSDPNTSFHAGYWAWNLAASLREEYPRHGLTPQDLLSGRAGRYRVILDSNTTIMDEELVAAIERYVRGGGVFVTFAQSGRHTSTRRDAWPISRLTGYQVTHIDRHSPTGEALEWRALQPAAGQRLFAADWAGVRANGLSLKKVAPECRDLMLWSDGATAIGWRPLGKGGIVQVGAKFQGERVFDRIEYGGNSPEVQRQRSLLTRLLEWRGIRKEPAGLSLQDYSVILRHYLSNNGLYDVWVLWNSTEKPVSTDVVFRAGQEPSGCLDVGQGVPVPLQRDGGGARLAGIELGPLETKAFLTPRQRIAQAPSEWLMLQRAWWRGTAKPPAAPLPKPEMKLARDLSNGWSFRALQAGEDAQALAAPGVADKGWERMTLGIWNPPGFRQEVRHALLRRQVTVPAEWRNGRTLFWLRSWFSTTFLDRGRLFCDGKPVRDWSADGPAGDGLGGILNPGTTHLLAVEIEGKGALEGVRGSAWLSYLPDPERRIDLAGEWSASSDALRYDRTMRLPGAWDALAARRSVRVDPACRGKNLVLRVRADGGILGVLVNGKWLRRHHHLVGTEFQINLTPWMRLDRENEIELVRAGAGRCNVSDVSLDVYPPGAYP